MNISVLLPYIQSIGIIFSLLVSAFTTWRSLRVSRATSYIDLVKSHRDLWALTIKEKGFDNILSRNKEDEIREISEKEFLFVNFVINHLSCAFELAKVGNIIRLDRVKDDIFDFFSAPVPRRIWEENKAFRNRDFVALVDSVLMNILSRNTD